MISDTHQARYDWTEPDSLSGAIVDAIANVTGADPLDIDPLYTTIDPDALDALFQPVDAGPARLEGRVKFTHEGVDVTVHADGEIVVTASHDSR